MFDIISSICAFSFPNSTCCCLKKTLVLFAIKLLTNITIGINITLQKVKIGLNTNIIIKVINMFKIPVINCTNEFDIPVLILSTSFVTLLIISPVELLSKKVIGLYFEII